ncbi:MAG TPA: Crp/Fnr family transcriptional regulator [Polyangiaceae bacterium]|jgi:CRP-like cAMP-binding protein
MLEKHLALLSSIPLFTELSGEQLAKIAALARVQTYSAREVVVSQGEPARALFAIVRGRLKVVSCGPDGRDTLLGIMSDGEVFGEVALLDGGVRSATCTTLEPGELLLIERDQFRKLLQESPAISLKLLEVLARRLRRLSQRSEDAASLDVPGRLARSLLELASRFGESMRPPSREILITLQLSQQELGDMIGATRESVNKQLSDWTRQGFLRLQAGRMVIADIQRIRGVAQVGDD